MGKVVLAAITQSLVPEIETPGDLLSYFARVSSTANEKNTATGPRLLRYLIDNKEWSPYEMINLVFTIETERDVARQMLRHDFRFQEFSQRYAVVLAPFIRRRARMQDHKNRQNSFDTEDARVVLGWSLGQWLVGFICGLVYRTALRFGVAKEVARSVLPEGMTASRMHANGYLRNWFFYCHTRCNNKTQREHREIAWQIRDILAEQFPDLADRLPQREV